MSDLTFRIWGYSPSHSFLLLRSENFKDDETTGLITGYSIDVEFIGVDYINMPALLHGLNILEKNILIPTEFNYYKEKVGYKIFAINSTQVYYVVAANYIVGKHR